MALAAGMRLGPYEVVAPIGAGGMGEVYRARDTKLGREVAIKILPSAVARDPERVARFEREARTLAALNHPGIAHIHGFEDSTGTPALVMELVNGATLADRIEKGPIPFDEALPIARQIAEALEAAHEQGVIHRDLKPANIKLRPDGTVKVLDFGLAKALDPTPEAAPTASMSPTITTPAMTVAGVILGTAAFMSPEQAKGRPADKRSDIWAFGCVLFEMLSGVRAFEGEDVSDTLANVLKTEPNWDALPADVPPNVRALLRRCLSKDPTARVANASIIRYVLDDPAPAVAAYPGRKVADRSSTGLVLSASAAAILITAVVTWLVARPAPPKPESMRFAIVPPATQSPSFGNPDRAIAISRDGRTIAYVGQGQLFVRPIDRLDPASVAVTGGRNPVFSPDGRWVAFYQNGIGWNKVSVTGGPPTPITTRMGSFGPRGATWTDDDTFIFATSEAATGLLSVPAQGGDITVLTRPQNAREGDHLFPSALPGGRAVLFTMSAVGSVRNDEGQIAVLDRTSGQVKVLIRGGTHGQYVNTGYIVYAAGGTLRGIRFDASRLEIIGDPFALGEQVLTTAVGAAQFAVSESGTLLYAPGGQAGSDTRSLVWVARDGHEEPIAGAPLRGYTYARLSPDGSRVALDIRDSSLGIWVWDLTRGGLMALTTTASSATDNEYPAWAQDGRRIAFARTEGGPFNLYVQPADGTGSAEPIVPNGPESRYPDTFAPEGTLIFSQFGRTTGLDLMRTRADGAANTGQPEPLIQTPGNDRNPNVSPDGHWLVYQSNVSGREEIYVQSFPDTTKAHHLISVGGGTRPLWARSGKEIFYLDESGAMISVPVETTPVFRAGRPTRLFDARPYYNGTPARGYDAAPDGQRFLMIREVSRKDPNATPAAIVVVLNWLEELKQRVPTK